MPIGILEVERPDPARVGVPVGQPLRLGRGALDAVPLQPQMGLVDVVHDDRDVLEPAVVASSVGRQWPAARRDVLDEVDGLAAEPEAGDPGSRALVDHLALRDQLERQHLRIEVDRALEAPDRDDDTVDRPRRRDFLGRRGRAEQKRKREDQHGDDGGCPDDPGCGHGVTQHLTKDYGRTGSGRCIAGRWRDGAWRTAGRRLPSDTRASGASPRRSWRGIRHREAARGFANRSAGGGVQCRTTVRTGRRGHRWTTSR